MKHTITSRTFLILLGIGAFLGGVLSLYIGLQQSVWFDEAYSILVARQSWGEIIHLASVDVHPPMYYWILKAWMGLFGSSEAALRSMNVLFLSLSIFVMGLLVRRFFGIKVALTTIPFVIFAPLLLRYGFEIRMYSLASLIGVTATYLLVKALDTKEKQKRWMLLAGYAALVALGVYSLYFMALLWIAHVVWLGWIVVKQRHRELAIEVAIAYAGSFLLFLPWLPIFIKSSSGGALSGIGQQLDVKNIFGIMTYSFLYQPPWETVLSSIVAVVLILAAVVGAGVFVYKKADSKQRRNVALIGAYFIVPVIVMIIVTQFRTIYVERYLAHIAIGLYCGVGVVAALAIRQGSRLGAMAYGMLLTFLLVGSFSLFESGNFNFQRLDKPSVKQIATHINCDNGAVIFADGPYEATELSYYAKDCPVYFYSEWFEMGGGYAPLSKSPLLVGDTSELPQATDVFYVYYNEPTKIFSESYRQINTVEVGSMRVTTYRKVTDEL